MLAESNNEKGTYRRVVPRKRPGCAWCLFGSLEKGPSRIRTGDSGFAIRCPVSPSDDALKISDDTLTLFSPGLREQNPTRLDSHLERLVDAWPTLSDADKDAFRAVVRGILGNVDRT